MCSPLSRLVDSLPTFCLSLSLSLSHSLHLFLTHSLSLSLSFFLPTFSLLFLSPFLSLSLSHSLTHSLCVSLSVLSIFTQRSLSLPLLTPPCSVSPVRPCFRLRAHYSVPFHFVHPFLGAPLISGSLSPVAPCMPTAPCLSIPSLLSFQSPVRPFLLSALPQSLSFPRHTTHSPVPTRTLLSSRPVPAPTLSLCFVSLYTAHSPLSSRTLLCLVPPPLLDVTSPSSFAHPSPPVPIPAPSSLSRNARLDSYSCTLPPSLSPSAHTPHPLPLPPPPSPCACCVIDSFVSHYAD